MKKYFPFIGPSTTIMSLFLGLFGITAFAYMLTGVELDMYDVHLILNGLPNPIEFISDSGRVFNRVASTIYLPDVDLSYAGNDIFKLLYSVARTIVNGFSAIFGALAMFIWVIVIGPVYCVWFLLACLVRVLAFVGADTSRFNFVQGNWNLLEVLGV